MLDQSVKTHFSASRFLLLIGQYSKLGGAERQALILAEQLVGQVGCHVEFLAWGGTGQVTEELKRLGIRGWVFPLYWNQGKFKRAVTLWHLARFIKKKIEPDYLLPYIGFNCKLMGLIWRRTGAKFTWWNQRDEGREVYGSRLERYVINSVPDVVSNSFEGRDFLVRKFGLSPDSIHVINNGVVLPGKSNREKWREKLGLGEEDVLFTMVANLTKFKDHETLIRAFAHLCSRHRKIRVHLMLAGRLGETKQALKALAFDLGLCERIHFVGEIYSISDCYSATDIAVHSSQNEGCPNAVLEAMAHSLPVCGADISGIRQALGVERGSEWLANPGDSDALSAIMFRLAMDPELRRSLGTKNQQLIKAHFSPDKLADNVLKLIWNYENS